MSIGAVSLVPVARTPFTNDPVWITRSAQDGVLETALQPLACVMVLLIDLSDPVTDIRDPIVGIVGSTETTHTTVPTGVDVKVS